MDEHGSDRRIGHTGRRDHDTDETSALSQEQLTDARHSGLYEEVFSKGNEPKKGDA